MNYFEEHTSQYFIYFCGAEDQTQAPAHPRKSLPFSYIPSKMTHFKIH
jgi:hypothetical protein